MDQLTICKTCSKEVAKSASTCPHCGAKLKMSVFQKVLIVIGVFFAINLILILLNLVVSTRYFSNKSTSTTTSEPANEIPRVPAQPSK